MGQSCGADVEEKLSKGFPMGYDPLPQLTSVAEKLLHCVQPPGLAIRSRMPGISNTARFSKRSVASRKRW